MSDTAPTKTRRFTVYRRGDLSETHNANQVNPSDQPQYEGVVFSDGTTVVRWLTAAQSTSVWADFETLWKVHGHDDANSKHGTVIVWHDHNADHAQALRAALCVARAALVDPIRLTLPQIDAALAAHAAHLKAGDDK